MDRPIVLLIHGILSNGSWHYKADRVLNPFFDCLSVRYREYHALGLVNIFFWPWAIQFGALLGWMAVMRLDDHPYAWLFCLGLFLVGLIEAFRSGIARALPWLTVAALSFGAFPADLATRALVPLLLFASLLAHVLGDVWHKRFSSVAVFWVLLSLVVPLAAWGVGWGILKIERMGGVPPLFGSAEQLLLSILLIGNLANIVYREWEWNGLSGQLFVPMVIGGCGLVASSFVREDTAMWLLWLCLVGLMCFLEEIECLGTGRMARRWRLLVWLLPVPALVLFWLRDDRPELLCVGVVLLMVFGAFEPRFRASRAVDQIFRLIDHYKKIGRLTGRLNVIAHSLGTFLAGKIFDKYNADSFAQVVLAGGAVSERRDWSEDVSGAAPRILHVRNEHGGLDLVIKLLWLSGSWANRQGMGGAGYVGINALSNRDAAVHNIRRVQLPCPECDGADVARLHNYRFRLFQHTSYTSLATNHCWDFWLPCLWGHAPDEVHRFQRSCSDLLDAFRARHQDRRTYDNMRQDFLQADWNWGIRPNGWRTLPQRIDDEIGPQLDLLDELAPELRARVYHLTADILCTQVFLAIGERNRVRRPHLVYLNPTWAITQASKHACRIITQRLE